MEDKESDRAGAASMRLADPVPLRAETLPPYPWFLPAARPLTWAWATAHHPHSYWPIAGLLILAEGLLCALIIARVPYTEIDWEAYMEEVGGFLAGERDYTALKGGTGPLVYPAGFVYIFSALRWATTDGTNIPRAQTLFAALYLTQLGLLFALYRRLGPSFPPWALVLLAASRRIHSIFVLRLFNDGVAMTLAYASILAMTHRAYKASSVLFSAAVSVKMNVLLFAPAYGLILWRELGRPAALAHVGAMVIVQLAIGSPFLAAYPTQYLGRAFELGRVFLYKWTVNWAMLSEPSFVSPTFAGLLLAATAGSLFLFAMKWTADDGGLLRVVVSDEPAASLRGGIARLSASGMIHTLFICNFVGVVWARSLHYQFYSWYYHTLPALLWATRLPTLVRLAWLAGIEAIWNSYPPRPASSLLLLVFHVFLLGVLLATRTPLLWEAIPKTKPKPKTS